MSHVVAPIPVADISSQVSALKGVVLHTPAPLWAISIVCGVVIPTYFLMGPEVNAILWLGDKCCYIF